MTLLVLVVVVAWASWLPVPVRGARTTVEPSVTPFRIDSPTDGARLAVAAPVVAGSGAPRATEVTVTARDHVLTTRSDPDGRWRLTLPPLAVGPVAIRAVVEIAGQPVSAVPDPVGLVIIPVTPTVVAPEHEARTSLRRPAIRGTGGVPGETVLVEIDGEERSESVGTDGEWAVQLDSDLALGRHQIRVRQVQWEVRSYVASRAFWVIDVATPPTSPRPTPRPAPTGPTSRPVTPAEPAPGGPTPAGWASSSAGPTSRPSPTSRPRTTTRRPPPTVSTPPTAAGPRETSPPSSAESGRATVDRPGATTRADRSDAVADVVPLSFSLAAGSITPGRATTMIGTLGPTGRARPLTITLTGRLGRGVRYLSVELSTGTGCPVTAQATCRAVLQSGQRVTVRLRLMADTVRPPDWARQQLQVRADTGPVNNLTRTTRIDSAPTAREELAAAISGGPGSVLALLAIYLLALAAVETERRRPPDQPAPPPKPEDTP